MQQSYERPNNLDEALALLDQSPRQVLAGGTDVYAALGDHSSLGGSVAKLVSQLNQTIVAHPEWHQPDRI